MLLWRSKLSIVLLLKSSFLFKIARMQLNTLKYSICRLVICLAKKKLNVFLPDYKFVAII